MSSIAIGLRDNKAVRFWDSTNGKKAVMAVSGLILLLFVLGHMLGNLQVFEGPEQFNSTPVLLRTLPEALWAVRIILLIMVDPPYRHRGSAGDSQETGAPIGYAKRKPITVSTYASRTMYWSGPIMLAFVIYHLLDFTIGNLNPNYHRGRCVSQRDRELQQSLSFLPGTSFPCCCSRCTCGTASGACSSRWARPIRGITLCLKRAAPLYSR